MGFLPVYLESENPLKWMEFSQDISKVLVSTACRKEHNIHRHGNSKIYTFSNNFQTILSDIFSYNDTSRKQLKID